MLSNDTIFALATPPAKSGVAVLRISGKAALSALQLLSAKQGWKPNSAALSVIRHPSSAVTIDHALCIYFKAPHSFTGEDTAEIQCHGSLAIIRELLSALGTIDGLRPAEAGEFTRRAFLNGKLDLIEAEGLADLIDAETPAQKLQAMKQLEGALSARYEELRTQVTTALALLEAYIDFPEEEIPDAVLTDTKNKIASLISTLEKTLADEGRGERVREGIHIVILGAPNAGKSSLLNALAGRDAAIVSDIAGTTRDAIEVRMDIAGFPVILTDTAGLRQSTDKIEEEGVRRALARAGEADIRLALFDACQPRDAATEAQIDGNTLIVKNKIDLLDCHPRESGNDVFCISTKTGQGIDELLATIEKRIGSMFAGANAPLITRSRHRALLGACLAHLKRVDFGSPLEITCEELRLAAREIGKITGKIAVDDVLDVIFKQFCIGK